MIALRWSVVILLLVGACGTSAPSLSRVERERLREMRAKKSSTRKTT